MTENIDRKLYRFMSFHSFVDLIQTKTLAFVRPKTWEDPYEGFIFQKLKSAESKNKIKHLVKNTNTIAQHVFINNGHQFEKAFFLQCWSLCAESDAMWRIYKYENLAVRVEVFESKFEQINGIVIADVVYKDDVTIENEIDKLELNNNLINFHEFYKVKRKAFRHEEEVRLIYAQYDALSKSLSDVQKKDISHISDFINSVCLHPQAPDWFDLTMADYCKINNLNYIGKSKLYYL